MTTIILSLEIGAVFGLVLDRVGATNPTLICQMLGLVDVTICR